MDEGKRKRSICEIVLDLGLWALWAMVVVFVLGTLFCSIRENCLKPAETAEIDEKVCFSLPASPGKQTFTTYITPYTAVFPCLTACPVRLASEQEWLSTSTILSGNIGIAAGENLPSDIAIWFQSSAIISSSGIASMSPISFAGGFINLSSGTMWPCTIDTSPFSISGISMPEIYRKKI